MSGLFGAAATTTAPSSTTGDVSKDVALVQPPEDSISDLQFSPQGDFLAVSSWDKKVRIYQVNEQGQSEGKAAMDFDAPVLNCAWSEVSRTDLRSHKSPTKQAYRTVRKWQAAVQTRRFDSLTWARAT